MRMLLPLLLSLLAAAAPAAELGYGTFHFPDPPRTVVGVRYPAGVPRSALPLGGLGTGTVYLDSHGRFTGQALANSYRPAGGVMANTGFTVTAAGAGGSDSRPLPALVQTYLGHFPMADLEAGGRGFPLGVQVRACSPFVLGDARLSATPAALFRFRLHNPGRRRVRAAVSFRWDTPLPSEATGTQAQGNVDGFLSWRLGDLAPGGEVVVPVFFVTARSLADLKQELARPVGTVDLDADGAFNWEDGGRQSLPAGQGGCLSQHGFYLHYGAGGPRRAGTLVVGSPRLEGLVRARYRRHDALLAAPDGSLQVQVSKITGGLAYRVRNTGRQALSDLRLSVYANLEAAHSEGDDRGWLDAGLGALVVTDGTGACCALASSRPPEGGWCGLWGGTLTRLAQDEGLLRNQWRQAPRGRGSRVNLDYQWCAVTREDPRHRAGCTAAVLGGRGVVTIPYQPFPSSAAPPEVVGVTGEVDLGPGQVRELRFLLAWFYPDARDGAGSFVGHQYARWFDGSLAVARFAARNWDLLLRRTGEWQERIYGEPRLPAWLADQLVNSLYPLARNTCWLYDGRFTQSESFIGCPITETIVCRFYGSIPLAMFFPELEKNTMRQFLRHQRADGAIPFAFGNGESWDSPYCETQQILDSSEFVLMAWRDCAWWQDRAWAQEVYPAVKQALAFARTLDTDGDGLINDQLSRQYYDCWQFSGAASYTSGIWLAALRAGAAFARLLGDADYEQQCLAALRPGQKSSERKLWTGRYYRLWNDTARADRSDTCLAAQLTGQWYAYLCGLGEVLPREHLLAALEHIGSTNGAGAVWGLVNGLCPDGSRDQSGSNGHSATATLGETWCYAATCLYAGRPELGLPRAERLARNLALRQGRLWNTTWNLDPDRGEMLWGDQYYSNMCVWDLWGALLGRRRL